MPPGVEHLQKLAEKIPQAKLITVSMPPGVEHIANLGSSGERTDRSPSRCLRALSTCSTAVLARRSTLITVSMHPGVEHDEQTSVTAADIADHALNLTPERLQLRQVTNPNP